MRTFIYLESVGTFIEKYTLDTFAACTDNKPDLDNPVKLNQVCNEWIAALSPRDLQIIINI